MMEIAFLEGNILVRRERGKGWLIKSMKPADKREYNTSNTVKKNILYFRYLYSATLSEDGLHKPFICYLHTAAFNSSRQSVKSRSDFTRDYWSHLG